VGILAIVASVLASPAVAKSGKAQTIAKEQRHFQRYPSHRGRNVNATMAECIRGLRLARTLPLPAPLTATQTTSGYAA
jgi:hypothetical protein